MQVKTLLDAVTVNGAGASFEAEPSLSKRGLAVSIAGTGAISATVTLEVSNDGVKWVTRLTFTLLGTTTASDVDVDAVSPFPYIRGRVANISGTGAAVTFSVCLA